MFCIMENSKDFQMKSSSSHGNCMGKNCKYHFYKRDDNLKYQIEK